MNVDTKLKPPKTKVKFVGEDTIKVSIVTPIDVLPLAKILYLQRNYNIAHYRHYKIVSVVLIS